MAQSVTDRRSPCYLGSAQHLEPPNRRTFSCSAVQIPGWDQSTDGFSAKVEGSRVSGQSQFRVRYEGLRGLYQQSEQKVLV